MELPYETCTEKMPPKSKLFAIGGRCFLGSASILFDTAILGTHWIGPGIWLSLFYEYGKDTHAGAGKGSVPGIGSNVIPTLAETFAYLNFRYLVAAFYRLG
jgi:hypothetical protein